MRKHLALVVCFGMVFALFAGVNAEAKKKKQKVKTMPCIYTFYWPENSSMEGGYLDCKGVPLNPSGYYVAAPENFKYGSHITIKETGNWRDGHTYEVVDRGSRIVTFEGEDGRTWCHIDILVHDSSCAPKSGKLIGEIEFVAGK